MLCGTIAVSAQVSLAKVEEESGVELARGHLHELEPPRGLSVRTPTGQWTVPSLKHWQPKVAATAAGRHRVTLRPGKALVHHWAFL